MTPICLLFYSDSNNGLQWVMRDHGTPFRLPPRGPLLPANGPSLIIVIETLRLHVVILPPNAPSVRVFKASLQQLSIVNEPIAATQATSTAASNPSPKPPSGPLIPEETTDIHSGRRVCTHAAIGSVFNGKRSPHPLRLLSDLESRAVYRDCHPL